MKRLNMLGLALVAVCALVGVFATSAFALPEILPKNSWTGENDSANPTLETVSGSKIVCEKAKGNGKDTSDTLGEFTIDFEKCTSSGFACNTTGDTSGIILSTGTYHYVYDSLEPLGVAILFLPNETTINCTAVVKIVVKSQTANGGLVCLLLEPTVVLKKHLFHCEQEKGKQKQKRYWNDTPAEITNAELLCSINGGAFGECAELALAFNEYTEANSIEKF